MSKKRKEEKQKASTRKLIGIKDISDFSLVTYNNGELVYFLVKPSNISVLSDESIRARVYALMTVLKGMAEIEMCAYNSRENFDGNKRYLKKRMDEETNYVIRQLLEKDMTHLDIEMSLRNMDILLFQKKFQIIFIKCESIMTAWKPIKIKYICNLRNG